MINSIVEGCPHDIEHIRIEPAPSVNVPHLNFLVGAIKIRDCDEWKLYYYPDKNCIYPWINATIGFDLHDPDVFIKIRAALWATRHLRRRTEEQVRAALFRRRRVTAMSRALSNPWEM